MSIFLDDVCKFINKNGYDNLFAFSEIKDGGEPQILRFTNTNICQNSYSVAKAFVVTAIGLLFDRDMIDTRDKVVDILSDEVSENITPGWEKVTVDMALSHKLGLPNGFLDIDCNSIYSFGEDFLGYMMSYPFEKEPGTERCYTDGAYYLLARIVEKKTGTTLDNFLWSELFYKMRFQEAAWSHCPKGHAIGATGLYIRTEDMVKLGELYLEGGIYCGERIISDEWADIVLSRGYELRKTGFADSYGKGGMHGQMLAVFPSERRVVAWHSYGFKGKKELLEWIADYKG